MNQQFSFEKFNYLLRPAKQLERKLLIEALHRLDVANYRYIGFGSVYYADFILFHKYLYISKMTCLEQQPVEKRMKFNKPYNFIKLKMMSADEYIPSIPQARPLLVWLDYDYPLEMKILEDIDGFIQKSPKNSILICTVDARAKLPEEFLDLSWNQQKLLEETVEYYNSNFKSYFGQEIKPDDLSDTNSPQTVAKIVINKIQESMDGRSNLSYIQMFNFLYADNAPMITIGGILVDAKEEKTFVDNKFSDLDFICTEQVPIKINVPPLTDRERKWLDSKLVGNKRNINIPFEIDDEYVSDYINYAKHYPTYHEIVT